MRHVGSLIGTFEAGSGTGRIADGWQTATGEVDPNIYALDREVKRSGIASQCIRAQGDGRRAELWRVGDYMSAWIGKIYIARIWVRTSGLVCGKNAGVQYAFEIADSFGVPCATALVSTKGAKEWTPLTAVLRCPSDGRRVRVTLSVDAKRGMVWFDDLFVGEANFPLPRSWWRFSEREHIASRNRSIIQGTVRDWRGMPVDGATVMLEPGAFWAVSNKRGQFKLQAPIGNYTLYAFAAEQPTLKVNLSISRDEVEQLQLKFPMPSYPHTIRNADFEEPGIESAYVPGWKRWGSTDGIVSSGRWLFGVKAYSGKHFFAAGANANTKNGGIYQTISVKPGAKYEVSTWHLTIQRGGTPEDVTNRLGVDPTGGRNPYADTVLWTPYQHSFERWKRLSLKVVARAPAITIFLEHRQRQGIQWSANAFDCVSIRRIAHQAGAGLKSASGNPRLSR
ncbi:MAG TPA: hypothetical protein EYP10_14665 [Armatimonadetes bacterium]|nr:hypothetical protein [Armatimonadota bacterium]